jgi:hypothetical protein
MKLKPAVLLSAMVLLFFAGAYPAAAQESGAYALVGTWKLNLAQSRFARNQPTAPKEETMVFRVIGDQFELTRTGTQKDGAAIAGKDMFPVNGGALTVLQPAPAEGESYVETMIEPGNRFLTTLKNGRQIQVQHLVISRDGKTMSITDKGADAKGKPYESVSVYGKQ